MTDEEKYRSDLVAQICAAELALDVILIARHNVQSSIRLGGDHFTPPFWLYLPPQNLTRQQSIEYIVVRQCR